MAIDERLLELSTENEQLKAEIAALKKANEAAQIEFASKLATNKVDYETKEANYKRQIRDLTVALENRERIEEDWKEKKTRKTITDLYDEVLK